MHVGSIAAHGSRRLRRSLRRVLARIYGFDTWHVSLLVDRPYARAIIAYLNSGERVQRGTIVEIGCGLGDILRHVRFRSRLGLDSDPAVLRLARLLARFRARRIEFRRFTFPTSELPGRYDVIVMVNWIHHIEPNILKANLNRYLRNHLSEHGQILIDAVHDPSYRYNHSIHDLTLGLPCTVVKLGDFAHGRTVYALVHHSQDFGEPDLGPLT